MDRSKPLTCYEQAIIPRLEQLMLEQKIFLMQSLTIETVAGMVPTNRTYVSRVCNRHFGMTFVCWIGFLRVEFAKEFLLKHPDAPLHTVAHRCGFDCTKAFHRKFVLLTGFTPREWRASALHTTTSNN